MTVAEWPNQDPIRAKHIHSVLGMGGLAVNNNDYAPLFGFRVGQHMAPSIDLTGEIRAIISFLSIGLNWYWFDSVLTPYA